MRALLTLALLAFVLYAVDHAMKADLRNLCDHDPSIPARVCKEGN